MSGRRPAPAIVALLTDFGVLDPYVGIVKGVLLRQAPKLRIVDVSHQVPAQDLTIAAFWIAHVYPWFPPGTVHLCVVDPGVGGSRAPIAARAFDQYFVAPDNGLLSGVLDSGSAEVRRIVPDLLGISVPSRTFHARDLFAPVAARLASGELALDQLGPPHEPQMLKRIVPCRDERGVSGRIVFADHFGNLVSDIPAELVDLASDRIRVGVHELRLVGTYSEASPGECVGVLSSFGTLEIAQRDGNAAQVLGLRSGASVRAEART